MEQNVDNPVKPHDSAEKRTLLRMTTNKLYEIIKEYKNPGVATNNPGHGNHL